MMKKLILGTALATFMLPATLHAEHHEEADVNQAVLYVEGAFVKTPANGAPAAAGLMTIYNNADEDNAIVSATSNDAEAVELHTMEMDGDVMRMHQVEKIDVPAHGKAELSMETGNHLMFINPVSQWAAGDAVSATLTFENGAMLDVDLPVKDMGDAGHDMHGHDAVEHEEHHEDMHEHHIEHVMQEDSAVDIEEDMHDMHDMHEEH